MIDKTALRKQIIDCILSTLTLSEGIMADALLDLFDRQQTTRIAGLEAQLKVATDALDHIAGHGTELMHISDLAAKAALNKIQELDK